MDTESALGRTTIQVKSPQDRHRQDTTLVGRRGNIIPTTSRSRPTPLAARQHCQTSKGAKKGTMSMRAITVPLTDKSVKPNDAEDQRVLNKLEVLYEGGSLDGKTADFPTRDVSSVVVGLHRRNQHLFETYKRTICLNVRSGRTIFRWAGLTSTSDNSSSWRRLLAVARIRKLEAIVI